MDTNSINTLLKWLVVEEIIEFMRNFGGLSGLDPPCGKFRGLYHLGLQDAEQTRQQPLSCHSRTPPPAKLMNL